MTPVSALSKTIEADILDYYPDLGNPESETWCPQRYASAVLRRDFCKKQQMSLDRAKTDDVALKTFVSVNESVGSWSKPQLHEWEEELYGTFVREVYNFFYPSGQPLLGCLTETFDKADLGPGSNIGANGNDFYTKLFSSDLTVTDVALYDTYRRLTKLRPNWDSAEETRISNGYRKCRVVDGNKLSFVPKNDRTSRVIATEPTLNMFFQRGASNIIEERLRSFGIDLATQQDRNRRLAEIGSRDDSFVTIDLSSASDSFSLAFVRSVVPKTQIAFLERLRSQKTVLPDGRVVDLNMLSTMGNGYTFSFQTAMFSCMVLASFRFVGAVVHYGIADRTEKNWGVFGDDIIVPKHVSRYVLRLLDICGFSINREKTFLEGPFRESCGGDYLLGVNVRPVYAKTWHDKASRYTLVNRLIWWISQHHALPRTVRLLSDGLEYLVPPSFPDYSGIRIHSSLIGNRIRRDANGSFRFRCLEPSKVTLDLGTDQISHPRGERQRKYNPGGLMLAFLRGDVRSSFSSNRCINTIGIRQGNVSYRTRSVTVPNWDCSDHTGVSWLETPQRIWEILLRMQP